MNTTKEQILVFDDSTVLIHVIYNTSLDSRDNTEALNKIEALKNVRLSDKPSTACTKSDRQRLRKKEKIVKPEND